MPAIYSVNCSNVECTLRGHLETTKCMDGNYAYYISRQLFLNVECTLRE